MTPDQVRTKISDVTDVQVTRCMMQVKSLCDAAESPTTTQLLTSILPIDEDFPQYRSCVSVTSDGVIFTYNLHIQIGTPSMVLNSVLVGDSVGADIPSSRGLLLTDLIHYQHYVESLLVYLNGLSALPSPVRITF